MRLALIADTFPPLRTSGAVQLRDLSREFVRQGHDLTVMLPSAEITAPWQAERIEGAQVLRLRAPRTKDIGHFRRTMAELSMPHAMLRNLRKSPLAKAKWDGVVWYSPSIFHGPLVSALRRQSACKSYLIIRDIFPEWAVDMGLMRRGLPYRFFDAVARHQYSVADTIGVQTPGNESYFARWRQMSGRALEVLQNWLDEPAPVPARCSIRIEQTAFAGRKIFVYAGNIGIAQGMDIILEVAENMLPHQDVGFLFVGRGSEAARLKQAAQDKGLTNTLFFDEIDPDEISDLYSQCHAGIVSLDHRHKSHNIPGKFLTYMQAGLPVLATVNAGNDLAAMIRKEKVGVVSEINEAADLTRLAQAMLHTIAIDEHMPDRCRTLFRQHFSVKQAVRQITASLSSKPA